MRWFYYIRNKYYDFKLWLKSEYQVITRGYCDKDVWNLDHSFADFALVRLKRLKEVKCGHPCYISSKNDFCKKTKNSKRRKMTPELWIKILDDIIFAFDFTTNLHKYENECFPNIDKDYLNKKANQKFDSYCLRKEKGLRYFGIYFDYLWD